MQCLFFPRLDHNHVTLLNNKIFPIWIKESNVFNLSMLSSRSKNTVFEANMPCYVLSAYNDFK